GLVACIFQGAHHIDGARVHQLRINAVHTGRHLLTLAKTRLARTGGGLLAQQFIDDGFNHGFSVNRSTTRQPRSWARARRRGSGLVATGWFTRSSKGTSFMESL